MCVYGCFDSSMYICTVCVQCLLRPGEGFRASETELPFGCWESNLIPLQEQLVLLSELALQPMMREEPKHSGQY